MNKWDNSFGQGKMTAIPKIIEYGSLDENGDTWFLRGPQRFVLLDIPFSFEMSLQHKEVSASGRMGIPDSAPGITKLIVDKLVSHEAIARRAYAIFQSGAPGTAQDHWLRAERELLGM